MLCLGLHRESLRAGIPFQERSRGGAGTERKEASGHPAAGGGGTGRRRLGPRASEGKPPSTGSLASAAAAAVSRRTGPSPARRPAQRAAGECPHGTCDRATPAPAGSRRAFSSHLAASERGVADLVVARTKRVQRRGARGRSCAIPPLPKGRELITSQRTREADPSAATHRDRQDGPRSSSRPDRRSPRGAAAGRGSAVAGIIHLWATPG
jgi:hypothetical protein